MAAGPGEGPERPDLRRTPSLVGLHGVGIEVRGIGGIFNVPGQVADPAKAATGLSQIELRKLDASIRRDVEETCRRREVPLLLPDQLNPDARPTLVVDIHWSRPKADTIVVVVSTTLVEPARLLKDPARIVPAPSWEREVHNDGFIGIPCC